MKLFLKKTLTPFITIVSSSLEKYKIDNKDDNFEGNSHYDRYTKAIKMGSGYPLYLLKPYIKVLKGCHFYPYYNTVIL